MENCSENSKNILIILKFFQIIFLKIWISLPFFSFSLSPLFSLFSLAAGATERRRSEADQKSKHNKNRKRKIWRNWKICDLFYSNSSENDIKLVHLNNRIRFYRIYRPILCDLFIQSDSEWKQRNSSKFRESFFLLNKSN